jgi:hypothetical protein
MNRQLPTWALLIMWGSGAVGFYYLTLEMRHRFR